MADRFGKPGPSVDGGVAGFSVAATSLAQDARAKKQPSFQKILPKDVVLYQYEACPFCNKVKDIIDKLFQRIHPDDSAYKIDEEKNWCRWVDNHLVHVLSPNICRTTFEALESFDYITTQGNFSFVERLLAKHAGADATYFVSKKLKKKHNITDEQASLYEASGRWVDDLNGRHYLGGLKPNLADLAVFGVLRPIRHLKSGKDMVEHTCIGEWYNRREVSEGESSRSKN